MSTSIHIEDEKKDILVLERGPTQGLESSLTAEKMCSINFTVAYTIMVEIVIYLSMVQKL